MKRRRAAKLTERQAWKVVEIIHSYRSGMCMSINKLRDARLITRATADRMRAPIRAAMAAKRAPTGYDPYLFKRRGLRNRLADHKRVEFAQQQQLRLRQRGAK